MIWSVSTFDRRSGTPTPVCRVNFSIGGLLVSGQTAAGSGTDGTGPRSAGLGRGPPTAGAAAASGDTRGVRPPLPRPPSQVPVGVHAPRSPPASRARVLAPHTQHPALR